MPLLQLPKIHCTYIDWGRTVYVSQLLVWNFNGQGDLTDLTLDGAVPSTGAPGI